MSENTSRRRHRKKHPLLRFIMIVAFVFFFWRFENYTLKITEYTVYSDKITTPFRIAMISDLHATEKGVSNETILKKIEKANPAIVFMLGDMYTRDSTQDEINLVTELVSMVTDAGYYVYFVTGEHDTLSSYVESVRLAGAHVMDYKSEKINVNGNNVEVFGIDNVYFSPTFDLDNEFTLTDGYYSILMAHIPNYEAYSEFGADLTICGDTHGGIARLPFIGLAYYNATSEWFPELHGKRDDIYDKGVFEYDGGEMVITSGIGDYPVPARINNRPEIAVVDIMPEV